MSLVEQVVKKQKTAKEKIITALIIAAAILIPFTLAVIGGITLQYILIYCASFLVFFTIYGAWFFISSLNYEYEYAALDGTLRVDKVIAKRKRKKIVKLEIRDINEFKKIDDLNEIKNRYAKIYNAIGDEKHDEIYTAEFRNDKGNCLLVFSPKEKMLNAMKPFFKREIINRMFINKN